MGVGNIYIRVASPSMFTPQNREPWCDVYPGCCMHTTLSTCREARRDTLPSSAVSSPLSSPLCVSLWRISAVKGCGCLWKKKPLQTFTRRSLPADRHPCYFCGRGNRPGESRSLCQVDSCTETVRDGRRYLGIPLDSFGA